MTVQERIGEGGAMLMEHGPWLRRQREGRGWSRREMARRLIQAGRNAGDKTMPGVKSAYQNVRRWENGEYDVTERYKLYYCAALGIPPGHFGKASPEPAHGVPALADPRLPASVTVAYRGGDASDSGGFTVEREVLMTAHESSDHAGQYEQPGLGDVTLEQLRADVMRLAQLCNTGEPLAVFLDARRVRDRIYRLLDRRLWPREQTDLYLLLGCLSGLMGVAANRLGYPDAAEELIRAGWAYANAIDHRPLLAHLRSQLAYVAYWRGRLVECHDQAASGLEYLSQGPLGARLHLWLAREAAGRGDADTVRQAIAAAHNAREGEYTDDLMQIGGEYFVPQASHYYEAGAALAGIPGAESESAEELERAIGLYDASPEPGAIFSISGMTLTRINVAVVRLRSGALDAAESAFESVWSLSPALRVTTITTGLGVARGELAAPIFRGSAQARALGERIEEFVRESIVVGLHSLPGGPG
jgi:transcriptional regulator with XRE-family HTH domain